MLIGGIIRIISLIANIEFNICKINYRIELKFYKNYFIVILSSAALLSTVFITRLYSSNFNDGDTSIVNYSLRIYELFLVITTSLAVVLYPKISDPKDKTDYLKYINLAFLVSCMISVDYIYFGGSLVKIFLYEFS